MTARRRKGTPAANQPAMYARAFLHLAIAIGFYIEAHVAASGWPTLIALGGTLAAMCALVDGVLSSAEEHQLRTYATRMRMRAEAAEIQIARNYRREAMRDDRS